MSEMYADEEERETDQNGVEFGTNCLTPGVCRQADRCLGTCKLF
jgi:hypothetical protein